MEGVSQLLDVCGVLRDDDGRVIEQELPRDLFLSKEKYDQVQSVIPMLKLGMSSSCLTALQSNAGKSQRWPLLNLVRQVLKHLGYRMVPKRRSVGKLNTGLKKYVRYFRIVPFAIHQMNGLDKDDEDQD